MPNGRSLVGKCVDLSGFISDRDYGPLTRALLSEDEHRARQLLADRTSAEFQACMLEKSLEGETPLHAAVCWPRGLELLFEIGKCSAQRLTMSKDARECAPLNYARWPSIPKAVKILLDNWVFYDLETPFDLSYRFSPGGWSGAQSAEVIEVLCLELARRRRHLYNSAVEHLSSAGFQQFEIGNSGMVQENAYEVASILMDRVFRWPTYMFQVKPGSIYHFSGIRLDLAKALVSVGFNKTNALFCGYSPLMTLNGYLGVIWLEGWEYIEMVGFFIGHGNDLYAPYPKSACAGGEPVNKLLEDRCFRTAHHVAYNLGVGVLARDQESEGLLRSLVIELMRISTTDPCECSCATRGSADCTPASLYARGILDVQCKNPWNDTRPGQHVQKAVRFVSMAVQELEVDVGRAIAMTLIRSFTLSRLGMKHTCCKYRYRDPHLVKPDLDADGRELARGGTFTWDILKGTFHPIQLMEPEEMAEIWYEDAHLAEQLESLMAEFESRYDELGIPFDDFFYGHWWKRMKEVEVERDALSPQDREAFREIGVILEE